jgi:hypothetical protein
MELDGEILVAVEMNDVLCDIALEQGLEWQ